MVVLLCFNGCSSEITSFDSSSEILTPIINEDLNVKNTETNKQVFLNDESKREILTIIRDVEWEYDITKTHCDYCFFVNESNYLYYSTEAGLFNDYSRNLHAVITDEQRFYINEILKSSFD